jgi:hypothetical protein
MVSSSGLKLLPAHGLLDVKNRWVLHRRTQSMQGLLDKRATPGVFLGGRKLRLAEGVMELSAAHNAVSPNACGHGK